MNNNLWVFDTEDNKKAKLLMAYFYNGKDFIYCKNVKEVHDFLKTISRSKVWAHNLEYDINNIFSNTSQRIIIIIVHRKTNRREKMGVFPLFFGTV